MALLATYLIYIRKEDAVTTGFVLNNAFGYSIMVLLWVRYFNTVEINGMFSLLFFLAVGLKTLAGNRHVVKFNIMHVTVQLQQSGAYPRIHQRRAAAESDEKH